MKKMYESPVAEKIEFRYADQVVASEDLTPNYDGIMGCSIQADSARPNREYGSCK